METLQIIWSKWIHKTNTFYLIIGLFYLAFKITLLNWLWTYQCASPDFINKIIYISFIHLHTKYRSHAKQLVINDAQLCSGTTVSCSRQVVGRRSLPYRTHSVSMKFVILWCLPSNLRDRSKHKKNKEEKSDTTKMPNASKAETRGERREKTYSDWSDTF